MHALGLLLIIAFIIFIVPSGSSSERKTALGIPFNKDNRDKTTKGVPHGTPIRKRTKRLSKTTKENI